MYKDELSLQDVVGLFGVIGALLSVIMLVGITGAIDCDNLTLAEGVKKIIVWTVIFIISALGIVWSQREDDPYAKL